MFFIEPDWGQNLFHKNGIWMDLSKLKYCSPLSLSHSLVFEIANLKMSNLSDFNFHNFLSTPLLH